MYDNIIEIDVNPFVNILSHDNQSVIKDHDV